MSFNITQAEFDIWAPSYDADAAGRTQWSAHTEVANMVAKYAPPDVASVIDLGTGTGLLLPHLKQQFEQANLTGVDLSEKMLEQCVAKNIANDLVHFDLTEEYWPLQKHKAQIVTSSGVLEFIRDKDAFIRNTADLLQDDGLAVVTYQPPSMGKKGHIGASPTYSRPHHVMKDAFVQAGLDVLEQREFTAYKNYGNSVKYGVIAARKPCCV